MDGWETESVPGSGSGHIKYRLLIVESFCYEHNVVCLYYPEDVFLITGSHF